MQPLSLLSRTRVSACIALLACCLACCLASSATAALNPAKLLRTETIDFNDEVSSANVSPIFADYNAAAAEAGLIAVTEEIPTSPATGNRGYRFTVANRADDVYFGIKALVSGLPNNTRLMFSFDVTIASNVAGDCFGIGGSPGTSVFVKAGASVLEPTTLYAGPASGTWRFIGVNKGEQATSGPAGSVMGTVDVEGGSCTDDGAPFVAKTFTNHIHRNEAGKEYVVPSSPFGQVWLLVGFESGFEGTSNLYISRVVARIYRA